MCVFVCVRVCVRERGGKEGKRESVREMWVVSASVLSMDELVIAVVLS